MDHALAWGPDEQGTTGTRSPGCSPSSRIKPILYRSRAKTAVSYDRRWLTYGGSRRFRDGYTGIHGRVHWRLTGILEELNTTAVELQDLVPAKVGMAVFAAAYHRIRQGTVSVQQAWRLRRRPRLKKRGGYCLAYMCIWAAMMVQSADVRVLQIATKARDDSRCGVWQQAKASSSAPGKRVGIRVYLPFKVMVTR
ncbi:hypothetical protein HD554DRAFT_2039746 [Boletus coccyginus]|nr:hypothetical protein HD554DRAFT_2039746 [Boletus coccyginus]